MQQESPRIAELRRRVHADPASIAFAQLAEEYRRTGNYGEAINYCRTGLARHPGYLSARVTLGRSLMELGQHDEAAHEFELVLRTAPDNLAAIRSLAEIYHRRGAMADALDYFKRALLLARFDPELEESVSRISREMGKVNTPSSGDGLSFAEASSQLRSAASGMPPNDDQQDAAQGDPTSGPPAEPLIDFDALLASLGAPEASPPPVMEMLLTDSAALPVLTQAAVPELPPDSSPSDAFAALEQALRAFEEAPGSESAATTTAAVAPSSLEPSEERIVEELEGWLRVLTAGHESAPTA